MKKQNAAKLDTPEHNSARSQPHILQLPGFLVEQEIGLGDAIKRVTYAMGIKPCSSCERRAAVLNQWMKISGW